MTAPQPSRPRATQHGPRPALSPPGRETSCLPFGQEVIPPHRSCTCSRAVFLFLVVAPYSKYTGDEVFEQSRKLVSGERGAVSWTASFDSPNPVSAWGCASGPASSFQPIRTSFAVCTGKRCAGETRGSGKRWGMGSSGKLLPSHGCKTRSGSKSVSKDGFRVVRARVKEEPKTGGIGHGEGEIRTRGGLAPSAVFETAPIDHSGTSP